MGLFFGFLLHVLAIYVGSQVAQLEYNDIWRSAIVAILSYIVMVLVAIPLALLVLIPFVNLLVGPLILGIGTSLAAKMVLACDWKPAWTIGITVTVINLLFGFLFRGCA